MSSNEITLTAPNTPEMEVMISNIASSIAKSINLSAEQIDEIKLAVIEACLNSFEHSKSPDKSVTVKFTPEKDQLKIEIQDRGIGFNPSKVQAPDLKRIINGKEKRHRGWGLQIIRSFMDEVKIESDEHGTKLVLIKKKSQSGHKR